MSVRPLEWMSSKFRILGLSTDVDLHVSTVYEVLVYVQLNFIVECVTVLFGGGGGVLVFKGASCLHIFWNALAVLRSA